MAIWEAFSGSRLSALTRSTTVAEYDGTVDGSGNLRDISGHGLDMTPYGTPPSIASGLQRDDGNPWMARSFDGSTQYYSRAHDAKLNINDQDHTYTFVIKRDTAASAEEDELFQHSTGGYFGILISSGDATRYYALYGKNPSASIAYGPTVTATNDGKYHILQVVRSSDAATVYYDGVAGTPVSVVGAGVDCTSTIDLGRYTGGGYLWQGDILYFRLDSSALTTSELVKDRETLLGLLPSGGLNSPAWTFSRASTAMQSMSAGPASLVSVASGVPRIGGDGGGVLIEGAGTNLIYPSQAFNTVWLQDYQLTVTNTATTNLPDGTANGYNILKEDATPSTGHAIYTPYTFSAVSYTLSLYCKKIVNDWIYLNFSVSSNRVGAWFNLTTGKVGTIEGAFTSARIEPAGNGWYRCIVTGPQSAGEGYIQLYSATSDGVSAHNGSNSEVTAIYGAQLEVGSFATSLIPTVAATASRAADVLSIPLHTAGTNLDLLPTVFGPNPGQASKLTVQFDAKCEFTSSVDVVGATRMLLQIGTASPIRIYIDATGSPYADIESGARGLYGSVDLVNYGKWNTYKFFIDYSDLSRSYAKINNVSLTQFGTMTGTTTKNTANNNLSLGVDAFCQIKNLRILPEEV